MTSENSNRTRLPAAPNLLKAINKHGSIVKLAEASGVGFNSITRYAKGVTGMSYRTAAALHSVCPEVSIWEFLQENNEQRPDA